MIIKVEHLKKYFNEVKAVDDISFEVREGELFGFLGVNGAGKSTTINILSTLVKPTEGSVRVCGYTLGSEDEEIRRKIGIVFQNNCLDDLLTVEENLLSRASLYESNGQKNKQRLHEVYDILSLGDVNKRRYGKLSGGQKRRCEIAAALMHTPKILFLDEPTTGLDPSTRIHVWSSIEKLRKEMGMTVFLTTHYMEEAAKASHIVMIDSGRICAYGSPFELKERYANDTLKLYSEQLEGLEKLLSDNGTPFQRKDKLLHLPLKNTLDSLPILDMVRNSVSGFEVVQGNMDDVFLSATGRQLEMEEKQ